MTTPQPFMGLPNLGDVIKQVTSILPPQVTDAIQGTVGKILDPEDPTINIGDPQPPGERPIPVEPGTKELSGAVKAIDTALGALEVILKLEFLIPAKYVDLIKKLEGALKTVRGWLD